MDRNKCTYFLQLLVVFGGLVLVRSGIIGGYPRDRYGQSYIRDSYPPRHYPGIIRDPYIGGGTLSRRPTVVEDSSAVSNQRTNVVNNNDNTSVNRNSRNVVVNQSSGRPRCANPCDDVINICPYPYQCMEDQSQSCTGRRCQAIGGLLGRGHLGGGILDRGHLGGGILDRGHLGGGILDRGHLGGGIY